MLQNAIQSYHAELLNSGVLTRSFDTVWASHKGNISNPNYMWKMHLYADSYQDWYNLSRIVIPWLVSQNASFKTVNPDVDSVNRILQDRTDDQFGKAFTIYPNNEQEFKKLALGLEQVLTAANLKTKPSLNEHRHNIAFEHAIGCLRYRVHIINIANEKYSWHNSRKKRTRNGRTCNVQGCN